jgi:DNA repair protein RadD
VILRPYQTAAVQATWDYMSCADGNPAIVIPTAGGKSLVIAETARQAVQQWDARVGIVAGVKELVTQNAAKLPTIWPEADYGIYSASLKRRDRFNRVMFLQCQSVAKRMHELGRFDLLLFDEFHLVPTKGEGLYRTLIAGARKFNPDLRVVGYSATPFRLGVGPVCGPDHIFNEIAYEARIADLMRDGYLCPLISRGGKARADLSGVKVRGGEYVENELAAAVDKSELVEAACDEMVAHAADRRSWIVFAVSIAHAEHVAAALNRRGVSASVVHGGTPADERDRLITEFQASRLRALVNVNVLTTGFDAPNIDCVVMLRPTKSAGLYVQMLGRGFRLHPEKQNTLVLDFSGNVLDFGPVDAIRVARPKPRSEPEVVTGRSKKCPRCEALIPIGMRACECGYSFASTDPAHLDRPVDAPVLSSAAPPRIATHVVRDVGYARHLGKSGVPTLRVTYHCGLRRFNEYICLQHSGIARAKALRWWQARSDGTPPRSIEEAMALVHGLRRPARIVVDEAGTYPEIVAHEWDEAAAVEVEPAPASAPEWLANALRRTA